MLKYCIKRLLYIIPIMLGVVTLIFALSVITPGDPVDMILGADATPAAKAALREEMGLNDPVYVRYVNYIVGIVTRFDFGNSYVNGKPIRDEILLRLPTTIKLAFAGVALSIIIALPLGIIAAVKQYSAIDNISMVVAMAGVSMPQFWLGMMLVLIFAVKLHLVPASGISSFKGWILPVFTIGIAAAASLARNTRSSMLEVIRQDYMRTARAKGAKEISIVLTHGLKNASIPIISGIGAQMGVQLGGSLIVESVFAVPGLGKYMVDAINARNFPAVQGGVILVALMISLVQLACDLLYTIVDPRMKSNLISKNKRRTVKAPKKEGVTNG